jgi:ISXO2-like transposase domain
MFFGINAIEFAKRFCSNEACIQYLEEQKWKSGYRCKVCGCSSYIKGKTGYHRRCRQCAYGESVTANTLFHDIRMPLQKAFFMAFRITSKKKGMSTVELAAEVGVQQKTAWLFKRKMQLAMKQSLSTKLEGNVEVDEFTVGGRQKDHYGRKTGKKKATLIAVENLGANKVGNIHIEPIENFKADTLKYAIKSGIADSAQIKTDDFQSYKTLSEEMNIERVPSHKGKNFKELHIQIMLFKNWLRGIHHKCSNTLYFAYCDEYTFRFNRRNNRKAIFGQLMKAMLHSNPHPKRILKTLRAYST